MRIGLVIYGSLSTLSGGYLYDRMLVNKLIQRGDSVEIISMPRRAYTASIFDNLRDWAPAGLDLILQDELNHPSLFLGNRRPRRAPIITIVHHLRSSERRFALANLAYRYLERLYLRTVDGFVFNSDTTRASVERLTAKASASVVATPGGDRLGTSEQASVLARAIQSGPLKVIFVGNLIPAKGLDVLLNAMVELPRDQVHLDVVGSDASAPLFAGRMRRMVEARRLPVRFWGALDEASLATRLRHAHVLAVPSYYEGFGIVFLEGMAHGLAVLGTTSGAVPDIVTNGEQGYLVRPGDFGTLAARLAQLAGDRRLVSSLGEAALRRYREFPTWDQTTDRICEFLTEVCARGPVSTQ